MLCQPTGHPCSLARLARDPRPAPFRSLVVCPSVHLCMVSGCQRDRPPTSSPRRRVGSRGTAYLDDAYICLHHGFVHLCRRLGHHMHVHARLRLNVATTAFWSAASPARPVRGMHGAATCRTTSHGSSLPVMRPCSPAARPCWGRMPCLHSQLVARNSCSPMLVCEAATTATDKRVLETLFSELDPTSLELLLSQAGEAASRAASCAFTAFPTTSDTRVPDEEYRVMLLRRLRLPLPLAPRRCSCGGGLDVYGDHRSACAQVGVLARKAGPLEQAAARSVEKQAPESPSIAPCVTSTWMCQRPTGAGSRWWPPHLAGCADRR